MIYGAEEKAEMALPRLHMNFKQHLELCVQLHVLVFLCTRTSHCCTTLRSPEKKNYSLLFRALLSHHKTLLQHKSGIRGSQM